MEADAIVELAEVERRALAHLRYPVTIGLVALQTAKASSNAVMLPARA
jgi:hypothetical protein